MNGTTIAASFRAPLQLPTETAPAVPAAAIVEDGDSISLAHVVDLVANCLHHARRLMSWNHRGAGRALRDRRPIQVQVAATNRRGAQSDYNLASSRLRIGEVAELDTSITGQKKTAHEEISSLRIPRSMLSA
jgi:hypothetical protein